LAKCLVDELLNQIKTPTNLFRVISETKLSGTGLSAFEHPQEEIETI
jgi:hypothetical protein